MPFSQVIPAQPGYFLVYVDAEPGQPLFVERSPIIAWHVEQRGVHDAPDSTPITADNDTSGQILLAPNGRAFHFGVEQWYATLDSAVKAEAGRQHASAGKGLA